MASNKKPVSIKTEPAAVATPNHFIKAWRLFRTFKTQTALSEATRAHDPEGKGLPRVTLLRLEKGLTRLNQGHLEILSNTLRVSQRDLLGTDPNASGDIFSIYAGLSMSKKKAAQKFLRSLKPSPKRR